MVHKRDTMSIMKAGNKRSGFTIIELLLVIVVIAILAVLAVTSYRNLAARAYKNRATSEISSIARAVLLYQADRGSYPPDVERNIPVAIFDYTGNEAASQWPKAPWPGSVYDYDYFTGSDGQDVVQISIRFCPIGGPLSACRFPNEPWAAGFDLLSSAYWCIKGRCRAHPDAIDNYPAYCMNCTEN